MTDSDGLGAAASARARSGAAPPARPRVSLPPMLRALAAWIGLLALPCLAATPATSASGDRAVDALRATDSPSGSEGPGQIARESLAAGTGSGPTREASLSEPGVGSLAMSRSVGSLGQPRAGAQPVAAAGSFSLSGTVFEDVQYGGGAGRNRSAASGVGRPSARVELFDGAGPFISATSTDASGNYSFSGLAAGAYTVRVVSTSVSSSRSGYVVGLLPVQTFRTNASTGTAADVTDYVGGHDPATADQGNASAGWILTGATGGFSGSGSGKAHAFAPVTLVAANVTGVDFGFNFDTIVNTNNSGQGSLRQLLINANTLGGDATLVQVGRTAGVENAIFMLGNGTAASGLRASINFFVGGAATISPTSALPAISAPMILNAQTQPGWSGAPILELNGAGAGAGVNGLILSGTAVTVRGFIINRFSASGVQVNGAGALVAGNWLGLDATGTLDRGNGVDGVTISAANAMIGGTAAADRNVSSGNDDEGFDVDPSVAGTVIRGNYIGTNASGTAAVGNGVGSSAHGGILAEGSGTRIGGALPNEGNLISGNLNDGIRAGGTANVIEGNRIGTDATGTSAIPNNGPGVLIVGAGGTNHRVGGGSAGQGNTIAFNLSDGIRLEAGSGTGNALSGNAIFSNTGLGIDLNGDGPTANDGAKPAGQPNLLMDSPVFASAVLTGTTLSVAGHVGTAPGQVLFANARVEVFESDNDGSTFGEGRTYLGFLTADGNGNFAGAIDVTGRGLVTGESVTGTATDAGNNTSEFGSNRVVVTFGITVTPTAGLVTTEAGGTATFTVRLDSQPTADVTVGLTSSDLTEGTVAPGSLTFTSGDWSVAQTVTVTGVDDAVVDGAVAYTIVSAAAVSADPAYNGMNAADVSVTNSDDDVAGITLTPTAGLVTTEAGGTATFTVRLDSQPTADVTVGLTSSDPTEGTVAPGSLTFTSGDWSVAQTVTVTGVDDAVVDGAVAYTIVTAAATSGDPAYNGMNAADVSVTNTDDDVAGITVTPTAGLVTTEAGGTATFTVRLDSQPTADVTVGLTSSDLTEGTVAPGSLTFTSGDWSVAQTVTVTGVDDAVVDGAVAYTIVTAAATSGDPAYNSMNAADVSVTNTDDDVAGITVTPTAGLVTTEAGGAATFTVRLDSQPTADVTVGLTSSDLTEGTVAPGSLTFTSGDWSTPQTVTVTGVDDAVVDGAVAYTIVTAAATSGDPTYNGSDPADVGVMNADDDTLVVAPRADATRSTFVASPTVVLADGAAASTLSATVRDAAGQPLAGRTVAFTSDRGSVDTITPGSAVTDVNGIAGAQIRSMSTGLVTLTADVVTDTVRIAQQPQVTFTLGVALELGLSASRREVEQGQAVRYTAVLRNLSATPIGAFQVSGVMPPNFRYLSGTTLLNGAPAPDPATGPVLTFALDSLPGFVDQDADGRAGPGESGHATLSFQLVPGAGAVPGQYHTRAVAVDGCDACGISNPVTATVQVVNSEVFTRSTLLGRVFEDRDGNGRVDAGEPGVAGAVIALDDGTHVTTDAQGRFSVPDVEAGPRVVKFDAGSLSLPATLTTEATQVLNVSPGLLTTVRFGVMFSRDTVRVGRPEVEGLIVSSDPLEDAVSVAGNVLQGVLVVNGRTIAVRGADARLGADGLEEVIRLDGAELESPPVFSLEAAEPSQVAAWRLVVRDSAGTEFRSLHAAGAPPSQLRWDGRGSHGELVRSGAVYDYQFSVVWQDGLEALGPRRSFGVDRRTAIALRMTGDSFQPGRAVLTPSARASLSRLAQQVRRSPGEGIVIEGHTDSTGARSENERLSRARAEAALDWLVRHERLAPERFQVHAWGEQRPIASNSTAHGRELNRRVEIHGQGTAMLRARLLDVWRGVPSARVAGRDVPVDSAGRFACDVPLEGRDSLVVALLDRRGGMSVARVAVPAVEITEPRGEVRIAFGARAGGVSVAPRVALSPSSEPLVSSEALVREPIVARTHLEGRTVPGSRVEVDGQPVVLDETGRFRADLELLAGENVFGIVVRDPWNTLRVSNVTVRALDRESDGRRVIVADREPPLELVLPPRGATMTTPSLRLSGRTLPGHQVAVNGDTLRVAEDGSFAGEVMLPEGMSTLLAEAFDDAGRRSVIERQMEVKSKRMFLVALADGVVGQGAGSTVSGGGSGSGTWTEGRVAYYLKGWVGGRFLVTSAFDSRRRELRDLFRGLDARSRDRLLSNLDPDRLYPVYGDSSTIGRDAPNSGRFYLGVESEQVRAAVGEFPVAFDDVELSAFHRTLYGAQVRLDRPALRAGEAPASSVALFGAENRHVPIRDELQATGGSLYYLSHADVVEGSVQLSFVVRDAGTGLVLARVPQVSGADYIVKELEGRVLFARPVPSVWDDGTLVSDSRLRGQPVTLEVSYETRGAAGDHAATGARVRHSLSPWLAVGGTWLDDDAGAGSYRVRGADAELRPIRGSRLAGEFATSVGTSSRTWTSADGGLGWVLADTTARLEGNAYKAVAEVDAGEWFGVPGGATASGYFKRVEPGFAAEALRGDQGMDRWGLRAQFDGRRWGRLSARLDRDGRNDPGAPDSGASEGGSLAGLMWSRDGRRLGVATEFQRRARQFANSEDLGSSAAGARVWWSPVDRVRASVERQETLSGVSADQTSLGLEYKVLPSLALEARASEGSLGRSIRGGATLTAGGRSVYVREERSRGGSPGRAGTLFGVQAPLGRMGRAYTEYQWQRLSGSGQRMSVMGIEQGWRHASGLLLRVSGEHGAGGPPSAAGSRTAVAAELALSGGSPLTGATRGEWRLDGAGGRDRQFLTSTDLELKLVAGLSARGGWRFGQTRRAASGTTPMRYEESRFGLVFRPLSERVTALAKWTRLADRRSLAVDDATRSESVLGVASLEGTVVIAPAIEWSGKGAARVLRDSRDGLPTADLHSALWVNRLDFRVARPVRLGVEHRVLSQREAGDRLSGLAQELSWDPRTSLRFGVGFNFSRVSGDELARDMGNAHGWFVRAQTRY